MQTTFAGPIEAKTAILTFIAGPDFNALPEDLRTLIVVEASAPSPVAAIANIAEAIYARQAETNDAARDLTGSLASYASANAWYGLDVDGRGNRIALAMRRENGETAPEGSAWPDPETDPAPAARYSPQPMSAAPVPLGPTGED